MRIYANCMEMDNEVKRDLHEMGVRVHPRTMQDIDVEDRPEYETLELSPCDFMILDGRDRDELIVSRGANLNWCMADFQERVGGQQLNPGYAWKLRRETWEPFIHGGEFSYTYSERINRRINHESMLNHVINILQDDAGTRQAILPIFQPEDIEYAGGIARIPCSIYYQFLLRPDGLRAIYTMRSSDFATHFPYDIWMALELQAHIAAQLKSPVGPFTFFTGSLHLYRKDADAGVF